MRKDDTVKFEIGGKNYDISLTLNVIAQMQERYGELGGVYGKSNDIKEFGWMIAVMVNDAVENWNDDHEDKKEAITPEWAMRKVNVHNIAALKESLFTAFESPDKDEDESPNAPATV